ncbi:cation efflux family-domain-containing protein [Xylariaceae sp. FL0255]|nr:cation efflux family-domain-containing protein [Xylariaceae sp. FL0255]
MSGEAASTSVEAGVVRSEEELSTVRPTAAGHADVESQNGSTRYRDGDPYNLASGFKSERQLHDIKANTSRKRTSPFKLGHSNKIASFYQSQNETIKRLLKSVEEHRADAQQEASEDHLAHQIAVYGSLAANIILAALQLYAASTSGSLSLFTTSADSVFDLLSNLTLIFTHRAIKKVDPRNFPSGKARLENAGNIAFCFLLTAVSILLIAFSIERLVTHTAADSKTNTFHLPSVIAVAVAFGTKFLLFLYCWGLKDKYSQIGILWQDHRNDLLINGFGVLTSVGGSKLVWWLDPFGSILLSTLLIFLWLRTAVGEFKLLVGVVASVEVQQLITYVCLTHSPEVLGIDTVRVYHSGPRLIAEVDIVMDPDSTLRATHDCAEELQIKLEDLPDIERAYVHVDYETTHKPEHAVKKDI